MRATLKIKFNVSVDLPSGLKVAARSAPTVRRRQTKTGVVEKSNKRCFVTSFNENNNRRFGGDNLSSSYTRQQTKWFQVLSRNN